MPSTTTTKISARALEIRARISSTLKTWLASLLTLVDYEIQPCSLEAIGSISLANVIYIYIFFSFD